ncbi:MAG: site-specific integrase [Bacteroidales bacterium]|nr:site-specific integrase [Bacteroidales bacterium]
MAVTFYLFTRPDKKGDHPINVSIYLHGVRFCSSIGYSISPQKWDENAMKVKHGASNAKKVPFNLINSRIAAITSTFDALEANNAKLSKDQIKRKLSEVVGRSTGSEDEESGGPVGFFKHFDEFLLDGAMNHKWAINTAKKFGTLRKHIMKFNENITLDDWDKETFDAYVRFDAIELQMLDVSISKELTMIRWYLGWCVEKGYTSVVVFKSYKARLKDTKKPVIFLTKEELLKLYNFKIPKNGTTVTLHTMNGDEYVKVVEEKQSLDKVRDLFCFCAYTSLRYSDMAQLQRNHIVNGRIHITTIKTDDAVEIPVNEYAQKILDKYAAFDYDGLALPVISNQKMNKYLKDVCELCEFLEPINIVQYCDGKRKDICEPKWKLIGTHAARRTFICNALAAGVPPQLVMKYTGHADYHAMKPYIEVSDKSREEGMAKIEEFFKQ